MAVVFDPHQKLPGNKATGEPGTVIGTKYRMLVPKNGPFYTGSLVVKSGGKELTIAADYVITHPYMTSMQRTGRSTSGMIWIVNPAYTKDFTLDYHAVGIGKATTAQINAERAANASVYPSDCQWEQVIGDVYFPPVDIQFDWENWKGERELMQAIAAIGDKMTQVVKLPNPLSKNLGTYRLMNGSTTINNETTWDYDGSGKFIYKDTVTRGLTLIWTAKPGGGLYSEYGLDFVNPYPLADINSKWLNRVMIAGMAGSTYLYVQTSARDIRLYLLMNRGSGSSFYEAVITNDVTFDELKAGIRIQIKRNPGLATFDMVFTYGSKVFKYRLDLDNPPAEFAPGYAIRDVASELKRPYTVQLEFPQAPGDSFTMRESPGSPAGDVADDVYTILVRYHQLVDKLYRDSPAIAHVADKNNPHADESYGRIRAIQRDGIASDATLAYGKTQPQLADYVNGLSSKASDFTDKMLRTGAPRTITGTFTMLGGLSSVTSSLDKESAGVGTNLQVDSKAIRLLARQSGSISAGNNPITFKAGANTFVLYPDARGLQWNNKIILDPTTVGSYLPGNSGGGDGVFYGANSDSVTITGNGIETQPFICTWVPPNDTLNSSLALRMLTNDFGTSTSLAATPALIKKLADAFTGKLSKSTSYINGMSLASSVSLDKTTFNLANVLNITDNDLPVSTLQQQEIDKYSVVGHKHAADVFGIGTATTAKAGLIKYGGLVNDATLALDGSFVVKQLDTVTNIEAATGRSDTNAIIDIIRFGKSGNALIDSGVTYSGWMVSIKTNNYFVGLDYAVPATSFNIAELFPSDHEDTSFGIFVDIVDSKAVYRIRDKANMAEGDTLTHVGDILTDEDGIISATIANVTRLGKYTEITNHTDDVNAHTHRGITSDELGISNVPYGMAYSGGLISTDRGPLDFRVYGNAGIVAGESVDFQKDGFVFSPLGTGTDMLRRVVNLAPIASFGGCAITFTPLDTNTDCVCEVIAHTYIQDSGKRATISVLVNPKGFYSQTVGYTFVALAFNYGSPDGSIIIPIDETKMTAETTLTALNPKLTLSPTLGSAANTVSTIVTVDLSIGRTVIKVNLTGTDVVLETTSSAGVVSSQSVKRFSDAIGLDFSNPGNDPYHHINYGAGGLFTGRVKVNFNYGGNRAPRPEYVSAIAYFDYLWINRTWRVLEKGVATNDIPGKAKTLAENENAAYKQIGQIPMFNNPNSMVYLPGADGPHSIVIR